MMKGQRVVVTGAGTGIGRGVALEFAKEGAAVVLHYSHSGDGAKSAVEEIRAAGGEAAALARDDGDPQLRVVLEVVEHFLELQVRRRLPTRRAQRSAGGKKAQTRESVGRTWSAFSWLGRFIVTMKRWPSFSVLRATAG